MALTRAHFTCCLLVALWTTHSAALTSTEQEAILNLHNALRRGEGSSNMQILTWNPTLAIIAQNWSANCNFAHGQGINSSSLSSIGLGQNIYAISIPTINVSAGVLSWFNEKPFYTYSSNTCATGKVCGHYTQVVWANTNQIGCGYTVCPILSSTSFTNAAFLVCNYASPGNWVGQIPYLTGSACIQCPSDKPYCNNGLCAAAAPTTSSPKVTTAAAAATSARVTTPPPLTSTSPKGTTCPTPWVPRDCYDYLTTGANFNGVYAVWPLGAQRPIPVFCDMINSGGGWTVFQRRQDGSENFYRGWNDYVKGFGNLEGEFWLGNENIFLLTNNSRQYSLWIQMSDFSWNANYAQYSNFKIASSADKYRLLSLGSYMAPSTAAGDALSTTALGSQFSTYDQDNDAWSTGSCAVKSRGAWWYNNCYQANLNGYYYTGSQTPNTDGIFWYPWTGSTKSLKFTEMKLKPLVI